MKRIVLLCCIVSWGAASVTIASSPGNPLGMMGAGRLTISAEWDQNNRDLELNADSEVMSNRYWLKGTYGLTDWLDVAGAAGAVDFDVSTGQGASSSSYESDHLTFGFQGGFKLRPLYHEEQRLSAFLTARGSRLQAKEFVGSVRPEKLSWNELQLAVSVARKYGFAFPYAGVLYSLVDGELTLAEGSTDFRDPGAMAFVGVDFSLPGRYALTVEVRGRLGGDTDEVSFSIGLSQSTE